MRSFFSEINKIKAFAFDVDGVLSSDTVPLFPTGEPMRVVNIKDGYALQHAVKNRFEGLGIKSIYMHSAYKVDDFLDFVKKNNLTPDEVLYMGDDIPDYKVMQICGFPCCPADAVEEIKQVSCYISDKNGGYGCGRDVIEKVLKAQGKWMDDAKAFGW